MIVWIIEMYFGYGEKWRPTVGCATSRVNARKELKRWRERNPSDKFRMSKYERLSK